MKFEIRYALSGGFGGVENEDGKEIEADDLEKAERIAWESACEVYDSYEGTSGLRTVDEIIVDDDCSEKEAEETWTEERESWLDYEARSLEAK
ncbi:hypothetical protein LCGC14_2281930 [marine sediment metagenome]|uniref:Uncharacterized protein n=1 Tax=marine sediment metagenome TaxID=412755 RepID=A0A0F9CUG4_9ZZZZ